MSSKGRQRRHQKLHARDNGALPDRRVISPTRPAMRAPRPEGFPRIPRERIERLLGKVPTGANAEFWAMYDAMQHQRRAGT
jgi:hypothetical protein